MRDIVRELRESIWWSYAGPNQRQLLGPSYAVDSSGVPKQGSAGKSSASFPYSHVVFDTTPHYIRHYCLQVASLKRGSSYYQPFLVSIEPNTSLHPSFVAAALSFPFSPVQRPLHAGWAWMFLSLSCKVEESWLEGLHSYDCVHAPRKAISPWRYDFAQTSMLKLKIHHILLAIFPSLKPQTKCINVCCASIV